VDDVDGALVTSNNGPGGSPEESVVVDAIAGLLPNEAVDSDETVVDAGDDTTKIVGLTDEACRKDEVVTLEGTLLCRGDAGGVETSSLSNDDETGAPDVVLESIVLVGVRDSNDVNGTGSPVGVDGVVVGGADKAVDADDEAPEGEGPYGRAAARKA
jgi:hypothetical protein